MHSCFLCIKQISVLHQENTEDTEIFQSLEDVFCSIVSIVTLFKPIFYQNRYPLDSMGLFWKHWPVKSSFIHIENIIDGITLKKILESCFIPLLTNTKINRGILTANCLEINVIPLPLSLFKHDHSNVGSSSVESSHFTAYLN